MSEAANSTEAKKTILVTGGNRGLGYEACRQLAELGHDVILSARDKKAGAAAADALGVKFLHYEVGKPLAEGELIRRLDALGVGEIDVVVNNAGIMLDTYTKSLLQADLGELDQVVRVNAFGPLILVRELLPKIAPRGHVINVSSRVGALDSAFVGRTSGYALSKTLLNIITTHLAKFLKQKSIQVNAVCPGWVRTEMGGEQAHKSVAEGAETIVWLAAGGTAETGKFFGEKTQIDW